LPNLEVFFRVSLEDILGENFLKNFAVLNYLEQGQNRYLYSKKANERKEGINHLINVEKLTGQVTRLVELERYLTANFTGKEHVQTKNDLAKEVDRLSTKIHDTPTDIIYKRLSTALPIPPWDMQNPIFTDSEGSIDKLLNEIEEIKKIHANYGEVLVRRHNQSLDSLVSRDGEIKLALQLGSQITKFDSLKILNVLLLNLNNDIDILQKPVSNLSAGDLKKLKTAVLTADIENLIASRSALLSVSSETDKRLTALLSAQAHLLEKYQECTDLDDGKCPHCGFDWETKDALRQATETTAQIFRSKIAESASELEDINNKLQQEAHTKLEKLKSERDSESEKFDAELYKNLTAAEAKFPILQEVLQTLDTYGIKPPSIHTPDSSGVEILFNSAKDIILSAKTPEQDSLPKNWETTLKMYFATDSDVSKILIEDLVKKEQFLKAEHEKIRNTEYQDCLKKLREAESKLTAADRAKSKISKLRKELEKTAQAYAKSTISDIELLFHIYSGRLIQNYQRGLGLFISSGKGDILKFNTAEQSEHDAILSMSSGQIASLGMAFFLTLNRVYAHNAFVLIDDPVQSMDEINVASLSDLLRVELPDRQILLSNHEQEVSTYMRYKFKRGGLAQASISMFDL